MAANNGPAMYAVYLRCNHKAAQKTFFDISKYLQGLKNGNVRISHGLHQDLQGLGLCEASEGV